MKIVLLAIMLSGWTAFARAETVTVRANYLAPGGSSSFRAQLWIHVSNDGYTSAPLLDKMMGSQLLVDGHPFQRKDIPFHGPAGISPQSAWEGCVMIDDYVPGGLTPGGHRLTLKIGNAASPEIKAKAAKTEPAAAEEKARRKQVDALAEVISHGLLRSCVENWLTEKDGGLQTPSHARYYVDPGIKVLISYDGSTPEPRAKGRIRIYAENRVFD